MHRTILVATSAAISLSWASPAFAQMKMSSPASQIANAGGDAYRPTFLPGAPLPGLAGLEEARVLDVGNVVASVGGLNGAHGLMPKLEGRWGFGLAVGASAVGAVFSLNPSVGAKYVLMSSPGMGVAVGGGLGFASNNVKPADLNGSLYVPISWWKLGPGDLHVVPAFQFTTLSGLGLGNVGATVGYALPVGPKWTVVVADNLNLAIANTITLSGRVKFAENLTADVTPISLTGGTLALSLLTVTGFFGGTLSDLMKGWGL